MKRILSALMALVATMGITTAAYADGAPVLVDDTVVTTTAVADEAVSSASIETIVASIVAKSAEDPAYEEANYILLMQKAAARGDRESLAEGAALEERRNLKIAALGLGYETTDFFGGSAAGPEIYAAIGNYLERNAQSASSDETKTEAAPGYTEEELYWLAMAITREAGSDWLTDEHQLLVGNVVLNRVASARYPDTIYDVLHQKGQYPWAYKGNYTQPTARAYANAERLLEGERVCPENVLFSSQAKHGWGVYKAIKDSMRGTTIYFCYGYPD